MTTADNDLSRSRVPMDIAQTQAQSEIQEYLQFSQKRRRLFPRAALVGLLAGLVAIAFRAILAARDNLRNGLIGWAHHDPLMGWIVSLSFVLKRTPG